MRLVKKNNSTLSHPLFVLQPIHNHLATPILSSSPVEPIVGVPWIRVGIVAAEIIARLRILSSMLKSETTTNREREKTRIGVLVSTSCPQDAPPGSSPSSTVCPLVHRNTIRWGNVNKVGNNLRLVNDRPDSIHPH